MPDPCGAPEMRETGTFPNAWGRMSSALAEVRASSMVCKREDRGVRAGVLEEAVFMLELEEGIIWTGSGRQGIPDGRHCLGEGKEVCLGNGEFCEEAAIQGSEQKNPNTDREGHAGLKRLKQFSKPVSTGTLCSDGSILRALMGF